MALAWSLPTGFQTAITYFYVAYFAVLLVHRQMRDDEACEMKYVPLFRDENATLTRCIGTGRTGRSIKRWFHGG